MSLHSSYNLACAQFDQCEHVLNDYLASYELADLLRAINGR